MANVFVPNPSEEALRALIDVCLDCVAFSDGGTDGYLLVNDIVDEFLRSEIESKTTLRVVKDPTPSEFHGVEWVRLFTPLEEFRWECTKLAERVVSGEPESRAIDEGKLSETRRTYATKVRDFSIIRNKLLVGDFNSEICASMTEEFSLVVEHSQVVSVEVATNPARLQVRTVELCCRDPRTNILHSIGEFEIGISLKLAREESPVTWKNLTRVVGDHYAPHIGVGSVCLGNMVGRFEELVKEGEYFAALDTAIRFVESVNRGDPWGDTIVNWPHAASKR